MKEGQLKEIEYLKRVIAEKKGVLTSLEFRARNYKEEVSKLEKELSWCENNY
jgi:hypothetical protein